MKKLKLSELNRFDIEQFKQLKKIPIVVVLDSIRSAMNVGSIFRSADAFALDKIIICGFTATPPHKEINKTAIGATESVDWVYYNDVNSAANELKNAGYVLIGIEQTDCSQDLATFQVDPHAKYALVFGNEVDGINDELLHKLDQSIEIVQFGTKHSLNVAVCAGIVLFHFSNQLNTLN